MVGFAFLSGRGIFENPVRHVRVGTELELYVDERKAIARTRTESGTAWMERTWYRLWEIRMLRSLIAMISGAPGVEDLGNDRLSGPEPIPCPACNAQGWREDAEGNRPDCEECEGRGVL